MPRQVAELAGRIKSASGPLGIAGRGTRAGVCAPAAQDSLPALATAGLAGVLAYEPSELYVRVGAGTRLADLHATLAEHGQQLAADPSGSPDGTVGGLLACGITGPLRCATGRLRDHLLGCQIVTGAGEIVGFGGNLIKNVAGYDVSRLMVGAFGTLGLITAASLRVRGVEPACATLARECPAETAAATANELVARGQPLAASAWLGGRLYLRVSGSAAAVAQAARELGGEPVADAETGLWRRLREFSDELRAGAGPVWMCHLPPLARLSFDAAGLLEWHGARRWFGADAPADLRKQVVAAGGSAALFQRGQQAEEQALATPPAEVLRLHRGLKQAFDPGNILNPGRLGFV